MSALISTLQAFFTDRLVRQREASPHTLAAYRDTLRLLLRFTAQRRGIEPAKLEFGDLDAERIAAFLDHLEQVRGNSVRTRNARLAAIHSLFRYALLRHPEWASVIERVLAIPQKRCVRNLVTFLSEAEVEALFAIPDRKTWIGRRDHTLIALAAQTGLRVSELAGLRGADLSLGPQPHVRCVGKGRKQRITPLTRETATLLRAWIAERAGEETDPVFPTGKGSALSRDALERRLAKYSASAAKNCPALRGRRVTPHVLRHTAAMRLLQAGVDTSTIALWLGHEQVETTQMYLHADLALKERALERTKPTDTKPGRYRPPDPVLAFLEAL